MAIDNFSFHYTPHDTPTYESCCFTIAMAISHTLCYFSSLLLKMTMEIVSFPIEQR